jgi:hypothetical protein
MEACAVAAAFQLGSTARWDDYRSVLLGGLAEHRGVIEYEDSTVGTSVEFERRGRSAEVLLDRNVEQFNWGWTMPSLSVSLSALNLGSVSTIICVPQGNEWQPFDPQRHEEIPDLSEFGVRRDL